MIRTAFIATCAAALLSLGPTGVQADDGLGTIYGKIKAKGHKEVLAKWASEKDHDRSDDTPGGAYDKIKGGSKLPPGAIDYANLSSMYVIIEDPTYKGGKYHNLVITRNGIVPKALAVSVNDVIRVRNELPEYLNVYIAGDGDNDIIEFPEMSEDASETVKVTISGDLELGVEEDEDLMVPIVSAPGLRTRRVSSGSEYEFEDLRPGKYTVRFWYWRLGSLTHDVDLKAGTRVKLDETLSVDRVFK